MTPRPLLRFEGATIFAAATVAFALLDGSWWLYLLLILAPDLGMVGYLVGTAVGSRTYNAVHTYALPLGLLGVGWWQQVELAMLAGLVWAAHIGIDRAIGYGLKFPTEFTDTHLDRIR